MSRATIIISSDQDRRKAAGWATHAPHGTRIEFKQAKRTLDQNAKMWAMLTDVSQQVEWYGVKLRPVDWKMIFLDALKREMRVVPNIDGTGVVQLGASSSDLSKSEMADLIELITMFGTKHSVEFRDGHAQTQNTAAA
jgi:hypothetical protein